MQASTQDKFHHAAILLDDVENELTVSLEQIDTVCPDQLLNFRPVLDLVVIVPAFYETTVLIVQVEEIFGTF